MWFDAIYLNSCRIGNFSKFIPQTDFGNWLWILGASCPVDRYDSVCYFIFIFFIFIFQRSIRWWLLRRTRRARIGESKATGTSVSSNFRSFQSHVYTVYMFFFCVDFVLVTSCIPVIVPYSGDSWRARAHRDTTEKIINRKYCLPRILLAGQCYFHIYFRGCEYVETRGYKLKQTRDEQ